MNTNTKKTSSYTTSKSEADFAARVEAMTPENGVLTRLTSDWRDVTSMLSAKEDSQLQTGQSYSRSEQALDALAEQAQTLGFYTRPITTQPSLNEKDTVSGQPVTDSCGQSVSPSLPVGSKERKETPIYSGVLKYFPLALAEVARVSRAGNEQHNPGQPLHWAKGKSTDHADCLVRHLMEAGTMDTDGQRHTAKAAWRALALLQTELESA